MESFLELTVFDIFKIANVGYVQNSTKKSAFPYSKTDIMSDRKTSEVPFIIRLSSLNFQITDEITGQFTGGIKCQSRTVHGRL